MNEVMPDIDLFFCMKSWILCLSLWLSLGKTGTCCRSSRSLHKWVNQVVSVGASVPEIYSASMVEIATIHWYWVLPEIAPLASLNMYPPEDFWVSTVLSMSESQFPWRFRSNLPAHRNFAFMLWRYLSMDSTAGQCFHPNWDILLHMQFLDVLLHNAH